uniref:Uncharacterized protein n=1 Tax=Arundo donax TaxID=35708 RepID=A0A0A9E9L2_ARUDO
MWDPRRPYCMFYFNLRGSCYNLCRVRMFLGPQWSIALCPAHKSPLNNECIRFTISF